MKLPKIVKKSWQFAIKNYFISIFLACVAFVVLVSAYKLFFSKPTYVYIRVKMGQGLWWASTNKPSMWFIKNIKKGDVQTDLVGKPIAEILSVQYFPTYISTSQYDVYLLMRLQVSGNEKTGKYNFNRSTIGVGAPIDLEFPSSQFSGTIIDLSTKPIKDKYVDKIIYLSKPFAYTWEYDGIKIGDKFFNGEDNVIEVMDKYPGEYTTVLANKNVIDQTASQTRQGITVKLRIKGKISDDKFVFGNDQVISPGKGVYLSTDNFFFTDYLVSKVE